MADVTCKSHVRGEISPIIVEVSSESETSFTVIESKTYCEVRKSSGELVSTLPVKVKSISNNVKNLYASWDTDGLEVGYYLLRFWITINMFGEVDAGGDLIEDYKIASSEIKRFVKLS